GGPPLPFASPGPPSPPLPLLLLVAPPTAWWPVRVHPRTVSVPWLYTAPPRPAAPLPPAPPWASPFERVRFSSVRLPAAVTWNSRKAAAAGVRERVIVSPVPWMVTGVVTMNAVGPTG